MKKILLFCLALTMSVGIVSAKKPAEKKMVTTVFLTDVDCEHCAKKIMDNIPSLGKGISDVKVDVPTKEIAVTYDSTKNSDATIIKGLASLKIKAETKPQEE